jgi:hypothetical protein
MMDELSVKDIEDKMKSERHIVSPSIIRLWKTEQSP